MQESQEETTWQMLRRVIGQLDGREWAEGYAFVIISFVVIFFMLNL